MNTDEGIYAWTITVHAAGFKLLEVHGIMMPHNVLCLVETRLTTKTIVLVCRYPVRVREEWWIWNRAEVWQTNTSPKLFSRAQHDKHCLGQEASVSSHCEAKQIFIITLKLAQQMPLISQQIMRWHSVLKSEFYWMILQESGQRLLPNTGFRKLSNLDFFLNKYETHQQELH